MRIAALVGTMLLVTVVSGCAAGAPTARVGECLDIDIDQRTVTELARIACENEHDAEVYFVGHADGESFDPIALAEEAKSMCQEAFADFVGTSYAESLLDIYYLYPQADSWANGDREVICAVYEPDRDTGRTIRHSGTLAGSGL